MPSGNESDCCFTSYCPKNWMVAIVGAVDADLRARRHADAELEPDDRARVETEEVLGQVAEVAFAERPREAVGDAERALPLGQAQAGRQVDQREVGLRPVQDGVVALLFGGAGAGVAVAWGAGTQGRSGRWQPSPR